MVKIEIIKRNYNGDYGIGSIFEDKSIIFFDDNFCKVQAYKTFCNNEDLGNGDLSSINLEVPFIIKENIYLRLMELINKIKKNDVYIYNERHYRTNKFDFKRFCYTDIIIDNKNYVLSNLDDKELIRELEDILKLKKINSILNTTINNIITMEENTNE